MKLRSAALAFAAVATVVTSAYAYTLNPDGTGFVGKGEVQTVLGLSNSGVQALGNPRFTYETVTETETTWTCDRDAGPQTQERARTKTTTTQGVVSSIARVKNQITGYNLTGFGSMDSSSTTDGPAAGSCPTGWTAIDLVVGQETPVSGGLYVNGVLLP